MSEEDKLVLGTIAGVDIILSPEQYKEYKGTLQEQIKDLKNQLQQKENIIKEVREYTKEMQVYCIEFESWGVPSKELLEILDKVGDIK